MIKALYLKLLHADPESKKLLQLIGQHVKADARILDVGCGYGRNLEQLQLGGFSNITGIDINPEIVASNKRRGFNCIGLNDLDVAAGKFDFTPDVSCDRAFLAIGFEEFYRRLSRLVDSEGLSRNCDASHE